MQASHTVFLGPGWYETHNFPLGIVPFTGLSANFPIMNIITSTLECMDTFHLCDKTQQNKITKSCYTDLKSPPICGVRNI